MQSAVLHLTDLVFVLPVSCYNFFFRQMRLVAVRLWSWKELNVPFVTCNQLA